MWNHSLGPYRVGPELTISVVGEAGPGFPVRAIEADTGSVGIVAFVTTDAGFPEQTHDNIHLFKAAPQMLAMLHRLSTIAGMREFLGELWWSDLAEVIALAGGE
jgi:hypothetical protein